MVFAGLFPTDSDEYPELRDALERLKLNDAVALLRAGDVAGARLRLPLRLPRPPAHGDRPRAARAGVRPRPARDGAERRLPRRRRRRARRSRCTTRPRCRASSSASRSRTSRRRSSSPRSTSAPSWSSATSAAGSFDHMEYLSEQRVLLLVRAAARRDRPRLLRPAEVAHARLRELRLRPRRLPRGRARRASTSWSPASRSTRSR